MDADKVWKAAQRLEGTVLRKWTKSGREGKQFTYKIRDAGHGRAIAFFRDGREVKSAGFGKFRRFYNDWCRGQRSFQNDGPLHSEAQVARFLVSVFELASGKNSEFTPSNVRYCRICFNSSGWRRPTGTAHETGATYYAVNGFGHEEWLFNYEWCLDGYKYGFLQPFTKSFTTFEGQTFSLVLYTKFDGHTFLAAKISEVYIPTISELQTAFDRMVANGWIDQMRRDVKRVKGNVKALAHHDPGSVINVRFKPADVELYDPMPVFSPDSKPFRTPYYVPLYPDGAELPKKAVPATAGTPKESQYVRAAEQATTVDPAHARLQNRLYESLCKQYGKTAVQREIEFVDLRLTVRAKTTFFEIKTDSSAKRCIRNALGQLFEYAAYPDVSKANKWVVVGDAPATPDDVKYMQHLRKLFNLPVFYAKFDWQSGNLDPAV